MDEAAVASEAAVAIHNETIDAVAAPLSLLPYPLEHQVPVRLALLPLVGASAK